jgi:tRNA (guanine6-N2)-methyltransferase
MINFMLEIIPGTLPYVLTELKQKHPKTEAFQKHPDKVYFASEETDVDAYRDLLNVLRISAENGPTRNLFRRDWRVEVVPAGINPALAYVLCQIAEIQSTDTVLDPFCGGGTIAITAALYFKPMKVLASDLSGTAVDKTLANFKAAGIKQDKYAVFRSNVNQLKLRPDNLDKVIANLPFGIRTGDHDTNQKTYAEFSDRMSTMVKPGGKLVLFTQEKRLLGETFSRDEFRLLESFDVDQGGLMPKVFVYKRV